METGAIPRTVDAMKYEVYFRRPNDCVVFAPLTAPREVSLVHRAGDGQWHCALCDATDCRHAEAAAGGATHGRPAGSAGARA